jgi:F-type H+-transporting ATPase subunit delta
MIPSVLFARYARSLADVVLEQNQEASVTKELSTYCEIFKSVPELLDSFDSPAIPREVKDKILARLLGSYPVSQTTSNFLRILLEHHRIRYFREVFDCFVRTVNERRGIVAAQVIAASPLSEHELGLLREILAKTTGKRVTLSVRTDADLLGGLVVQIGSTVYDGSIRRHLTEMRERLKGA